jgi:hypothetical protein
MSSISSAKHNKKGSPIGEPFLLAAALVASPSRQGSALVRPFSVRRAFGKSKSLPYGKAERANLRRRFSISSPRATKERCYINYKLIFLKQYAIDEPRFLCYNWFTRSAPLEYLYARLVMSFGSVLKELRKENNMTQEQFVHKGKQPSVV